MSQYPSEYYNYYSVRVPGPQWQGLIGTLIGVAMLVAMGAWAFSLVKKASRARRSSTRYDDR